MKLSGREFILAWVTFVAVLYVGTFLVCRKLGAIGSLQDTATEALALSSKIEDSKLLLNRQKAWEAELAELRTKVRPLPEGEVAPTYFKRKIDSFAVQHKVTIRERIVGDEKVHSGLHVLPITCRWEGTDDRGIRNLLIELAEEGTAFDTTSLLIQSLGQNRLKGSLTVNCKYTRSGGN